MLTFWGGCCGEPGGNVKGRIKGSLPNHPLVTLLIVSLELKNHLEVRRTLGALFEGRSLSPILTEIASSMLSLMAILETLVLLC
jgi:hypothetical protein